MAGHVLSRGFASLLLFVGLTVTAVAQDSKRSQSHDGRWLISNVTQDSAACAGLVRGALFIRDGIVNGYVAHSTEGDFAISGWVAPDGRLVDVQAAGTAIAAKVDGRLGTESANGRWRTRDCHGGWSARKAP